MAKRHHPLEKNPDDLAAAFRVLKTRSELATLLQVRVSLLTHVAYQAKPATYYKTWEIKKKSGGSRKIQAPRGSLYFLQAKLNQILQAAYTPKASTHGFVRGRSVVTNAQPHVGRRFVLNIDLKDFFPSINFGRVRGVFMAKPFNCVADIATLMAHLCCIDNGLAVGAPTSPVVANMVSLRMDAALLKLAQANGCYYTRYADDITFSTNRPAFPTALANRTPDGVLTLGLDLLKVIESNGFRVNTDKTRLQPKHSRQEVTGLIVNKRVNVDRRFIRQIRAMLHAWSVHGLEACQTKMVEWYSKDRHPDAKPQFQNVLHGKIAYLGLVRGKLDHLHERFLQQYRNLITGRPMYEGVESGSISQRPILDNNPLKILHLSDFHFREATAWDAEPMLEKLAELLQSLPPPDIVVVTGDIAQSGKKEEYDRATAWFQQCLIPSARVRATDMFFVAGNHDSDRTKVGAMVKALQESISKNGGDVMINDVNQNQNEAQLLYARFSAYEAFVAELRGEPPATRPWWVQSVSRNGINFRIAGLCSAWMSHQDQEQGKLWIGTPQVLEVIKEQGDVNVVALHHPDFYLHENDTAAIQEIHNWAHIVLRGHLHSEKAVEQKDHLNHVVTLAAGSAYQGSKYPNGFQLIEVYAYDRKCRVIPYRWDSNKRRWHKSKDVFENTTDGVGEFQFGPNRRA